MKKRILSLTLALTMILSVFMITPLTASAETEGIFVYSVEDGETTITNCDSRAEGNIVIPDTLGGCQVTSIGSYAFYYCTGLTSIEIPNSVTSIGEQAFCYCTGLTSIEIGNSVTSIGDDAFYECRGLTSIKIPNSVTSIGEQAFCNCRGLTSIEIPNSVTSIGESAFFHCTGLTSVTIGNSVTSIGDYAFYRCTELKSIEIPNSVTSIGDDAFYECRGLTSIKIPNSVTSIGSYAFEDCTGLTSATIGNSVKSIGDYAFCDCTGLTSATIGNSVTSIGDYAFCDCTGLTNINIPNSVSSIGWRAFASCSGLTSVTIGNSVTSIGEDAFYDCYGLTSVEIPNSVTSIGKSAFFYCTGLTSVTIGNSVTSIGYDAFYSCYGLKTVYYAGSEADRKKIEIDDSGNDDLLNANWIYAVEHTHTGGTATCNKKAVCDGCGEEYGELNPNVHTGGTTVKDKNDATCTETGYTGDTYCNSCNKRITTGTTVKALGHTGGTATCNKKAVCDICSEEYGELSKTHTGGTTVKNKKSATCTESGYTGDTYCNTCGKKIKSGTSIKALGHKYTNKVTKATLTKNGKIVPTCSTCKATKTATTIYYPKTFKLSATSYTYDGKVKKPTVKVTGSNGKAIASSNYTVKYTNNKDIGTAKVTITFKGNYSGTKNLTFKINPKNPTVTVKSAKKNATVSYKKIAGGVKYEIQYSTKKSSGFKNVKTNTTALKVTKSGLKKGKTYYFRVRAYKKVGSTTYYSGWVTKSVKIK